MNIIIKCIKRIVLSGFILYGYNLIAVNFNMIIPINIITLLGVTFLGVPALIVLVLFKILKCGNASCDAWFPVIRSAAPQKPRPASDRRAYRCRWSPRR